MIDRFCILGEAAEHVAKLHELGAPLVPYLDRWVILDPTEIARLPQGWNEGHREHIPASEALRAVLEPSRLTTNNYSALSTTSYPPSSTMCP